MNIGDYERQAYTIRVTDKDGAERDVVPFALVDLNDNDNNHDLCLDTKDKARSVSFPAGLLADPANDLNPQTWIRVTE